MKKLVKPLLSISVTCLMLISVLSPGIANARLLPAGTALPPLRPATLQNIKYIYQQNVKKVDLTQFIEKDGAMMPPSGMNINPGTILVDESLHSAFYVRGRNADGSLILRQPTMREVFENFELPKQTVKCNEANLVDLQPSIRNARMGIANPTDMGTVTFKKIPVSTPPGTGGQQQLMSQSSAAEKAAVQKALEGGIELGFKNAKMEAYLGDGAKLSVTLNGKVLNSMMFDVKFSMFGGYEFSQTAGQLLDMKVVLEAQAKKEIYIPIYGFDIDFTIGELRAGLFIVVGIDGTVTLVVAVDEGTSFTAGMRGNTSFGVPTSFHPFAEKHAYFSAECDPSGYIVAYAYVAPSVCITILGIDVFKAELRVGFMAYAQASASFWKYGVDAVIQFYLAIVGRGKNIVDLHITLFQRKKEMPPGGFHFYGDLCAYRDNAVIAVYRTKQAGEALPDYMKDPFTDKVPYTGPVQLDFYKAGNTTTPYKVINTTLTDDSKGVFTYDFRLNDNIDVAKGDSYRIVIPGNSAAFSSNIFSTIPFNGIKLTIADFYNESSTGQVKPVSSHRDMPGWALQDIKSEGGMEQLFCSNRTVEVRYTDPKTNETITQTAVTDSQGKFKTANMDIRPFKKATPYINIDGFEIQGEPIDTSAGIFCVIGTDYLINPKVEIINGYGTTNETKSMATSFEGLDPAQQITNEEYTSGDHVLGVNDHGEKKLDVSLDYNTNVYFLKDIETIYKNAYVMSRLGATVDMRKIIMDNPNKQLVYNDHATLTLNEANNNQLSLFEGIIDKIANSALQQGQPLSTSHAYHQLLVKDQKYFPPASSLLVRAPILPLTPLAPARRTVSTMIKDVIAANFADITDPLQPKGTDAALTLNMQGSALTHGYATDSIYVDTVATIEIEGCKIVAQQADPWILKGQKQPITGISPEDLLKNAVKEMLAEGPLYFKRFVINPEYANNYANTKAGTWRPSLNAVKHLLAIDCNKGSFTLDGIKFDNVGKGTVSGGKVFVPATALIRMMGGTSSYNSSTGKLAMNLAGRSIALNAGSTAKTAAASVNGRSVSLKGDIIGKGSSINISTSGIAKLLGAGTSIKSDTKKGIVQIGFNGN